MSDFVFKANGLISEIVRAAEDSGSTEAGNAIVRLVGELGSRIADSVMSSKHERAAAGLLNRIHSMLNKNPSIGGDEGVIAGMKKMLEEIGGNERMNLLSTLRGTVNNIRAKLSDVSGVKDTADVFSYIRSRLSRAGQTQPAEPGIANTIDEALTAELAKSVYCSDDPAYREAASNSGVSVREYCENLAEAYAEAGEDIESDRYAFLTSVADDPYYDSLTVDAVNVVTCEDGSCSVLSVSTGDGHGMIGIYTDMDTESAEYESMVGEAVLDAASKYDSFTLSGVGNGGNAAVAAGIHIAEETELTPENITAVDSQGFGVGYVSSHSEGASKIENITNNYISESNDPYVNGASDDAAPVENGQYIGNEHYMDADSAGGSDVPWLNWPADSEGNFAPEYSYETESTQESTQESAQSQPKESASGSAPRNNASSSGGNTGSAPRNSASSNGTGGAVSQKGGTSSGSTGSKTSSGGGMSVMYSSAEVIACVTAIEAIRAKLKDIKTKMDSRVTLASANWDSNTANTLLRNMKDNDISKVMDFVDRSVGAIAGNLTTSDENYLSAEQSNTDNTASVDSEWD